MVDKKAVSPKTIVDALNCAISKSVALDCDCQECRVRRVRRVTTEEAMQLGRNWNVDVVNDECCGECHAVLVKIALAIGNEMNASWP